MKHWLLALMVASAACSSKPSFEPFREASGEFSVDAPHGWGVDYNDSFTRKPIASVSWVGELTDGSEGAVIGSVVEIRKLWRRPEDHPEPKTFTRYRMNVLEPTEALFGGTAPRDIATADAILSGRAARSYRRVFEQTNKGGLHGAVKRYPSRVEGVVLKTPEAFYVLEYRATEPLFERHRPVFQKMRDTFQLSAK